jgi:hypothetical protein
MVKTRNPEILWKALSKLIKEDKKFADSLEVKIVGKVDYSVKDTIAKHELGPFIRYMDYMPHEKVISLLQSAQVLLLR